MQFFVQDPLEVIEYQMNWSEPIGESLSIADSTWVSSDDVDLTDPVIDGAFTATKVAYTGEVGIREQISNTILLSNGETITDSIFIYFENK